MSPETVTHQGSGLIFNNTFGSGASATFRNEVVAAENYLQGLFPNACTVNCNFDVQSINPAFSGENFFSPITVSYSAFVNALKQHATTAPAIAAAASLSNLPDPSHGAGFEVSIGEARILGLAGPGSGTDDTIILNSVYWTASALQNNPGDAEAVIEHEITEGIMGRIGSLGVASSQWAPMDLFRFTASGQRDFTGGRDGQATYFSVDGSSVDTGLRFHNSVNGSGQFDGFDLADWDQAGADANAHDPFGPGGPGAGDPGTLSATDITLLEALGWGVAPVLTVVGTGDFSNDGTSDILFDNSGTLAEWEMNGAQGVTRAVIFSGLPSSWQVVGTGDFNSDNMSDILLQNTNGTLAVWLMNGAQIQSGVIIYNLPSSWHAIATADFNGDQKTDILLENTDGTVAVWLMNGTQIQSGAVIASLPSSSNWHIVGVGDFSGDHISDIALQNSNGAVAIWEMSGAQIQSGAVIASPGSDWHVIGIGDFSGDHISDIALQNTDGRVEIWEMNGTTIVSSTVVGSMTSDWHPVGIGDFNGDHTSDILWQNNNGALEIWEMNGTQVTPEQVSPPAGAPIGGAPATLADGPSNANPLATGGQGRLDQTVSLLNQYMASSFANSDYGAGVNPSADPLATSTSQTPFLAQPAQNHLH
jgi:hypothetical protein